jgi:type I restriction enzyme S subunit
MITSVDNAILKPSDDFDAEFLVYLTNSVGWLEWIQDICRVGGGFRLRISRTMLGEQIIPVPPIDEQKAIAKELNLLSEYTDLCIQKCTEAIALLVERRTALISAAVTGKIDLRGWTPPAEEAAA